MINKDDIASLREALSEHKAQFSRTNLLLKLGFALTFLLYCVFNQALYLGDPTTWVHYFDNTQAMVGFAIISVIAILMALFLAWVKHAAYIHFGLYGSIGTIVFTVIAFALFAELFSSSANQDAKANIQIEHSSTYQSTLTYGGVGGAVNAALTEQIGSASKRLAQCNYRMAAGKEKHCDGDKAKLAALEAQANAAMQAQVAANNAGLQLNYARQDKLKADSYNPVIVMMSRAWAALFGGEYINHIKAATVMIMLFVSASFETLHHFLSIARAAALAEIRRVRHELNAIQDSAAPDRPTPQPNLPNRPRGFFNGMGAISAFAPLNNADYANAAKSIGTKINCFDNQSVKSQATNHQPDRPSSTNLTGQVGQVNHNLTADTAEKLAKAQAEIERRKAEKVAKAREIELQAQLAAAQAAIKDAEQRIEAERLAREKAEHEAAEQAQREAQAKAAAEEAARRAETERLAREQAQREAQAKAAAEEAARKAETERLAQDREAELDGLTEDQILIAANAIRAAISAGQVTTLGFSSLKDVIKDAGLPRSNDRIRILIKLGCLELAMQAGSGVIHNPDYGLGKPEFIIN